MNKQELVPPVYEPTYTDIDTCKINPPSVYNKPKFDPQIALTLPISLDDLGTHVASCRSNGFDEQYAVSVYCRGNNHDDYFAESLYWRRQTLHCWIQ